MEKHNYYPKVSIVIPVYNGSNYLKNAIDCALSQTYENLEVLVINDGSTDEGATEQIALSYGDRIRYFSKPNGGVSSALNLGIREMKGAYFSWLSHDDAYTPTKVADAIEALRAADALDGSTLAYSGGNYIDRESRVVKPFPTKLTVGKVYSGDEMADYSTKHGTMNGCCMLIPVGAFDNCGLFNEELRYCQDALMWYRIFFVGYKLVYDGKANVMYRLHPAQTSQTKKEWFTKDITYLSHELAPAMAAHSTKERELLFQHTLRMANHRCSSLVNDLMAYAKQNRPFTLRQKLQLKTHQCWGVCRGLAKKIYYRLVLRVKV